MKANELRIGNLLYHNLPTKKPVTVKVINCDDTVRIDFGNGDILGCFGIKEFKPIPLTEEWLLKFRFKEIVFTQDRNREWFKMFEIEETDELFSLCFYPEKNICYLNFDVGYGNNVLNIEFVHKLQNLYFALTHRELTVA